MVNAQACRRRGHTLRRPHVVGAAQPFMAWERVMLIEGHC